MDRREMLKGAAGGLILAAAGNAVFAAESDKLSEILKQHAAEPQFQVQIEADKAVPYGRVAELMAIAQRAGVAKLSFVTIAAH